MVVMGDKPKHFEICQENYQGHDERTRLKDASMKGFIKLLTDSHMVLISYCRFCGRSCNHKIIRINVTSSCFRCGQKLAHQMY
ncbi:hypothetical protein ACROYT_G003679 [Oculina patagonica]